MRPGDPDIFIRDRIESDPRMALGAFAHRSCRHDRSRPDESLIALDHAGLPDTAAAFRAYCDEL
jgi:hypothetical protein